MRWEDKVRKVTPYTPGEQVSGKDIIKLNTNENPYPPSPKVAEALRAFDVDALRLYPDPKMEELVAALAEYHGLDKEQVFAGVGTDDVLAQLFLTFFNSDKPILFADITYTFYDVWADLFRIPYEQIPLREDFTLDPASYKKDNGGIVIANPNAPTGVLLPIDSIEEMVAAHPESIVIVDEAYIDFGGVSALPLIDRYDNVVIVRTFSKSRSMAGLRIGYAMANPTLIKYLNDVKYSYNSYTLNRLQLALATAEVRDAAHYAENCKKVMATRERTAEALRRLGFDFPPSSTNFFFVTHPKMCAQALFEALRDAGIYVRYFNRPRIDNYLRISIGTDAEMDRLVATLSKILEGK